MKIYTKTKTPLLLLFLLQFALLSIFCPLSGSQAEAAKKKSTSTWPECPSIDAEACCVMDLSSGLVLYSKNMKKKNYPASITKIMTSLLAIENCSPGEEVTFSAEAVNSIPWDGTKLGVLPGERLSINESLYAIMLHSANDVCAGVAEHISGTEEAFAKMMTKRAKEIGCVNTHFTNPHGLHDDKHYTCAYDMCLIGREAMKNSTFRSVTANRSYTVAATNKSEERTINNHHQMINGYRSSYLYEYEHCIGGKTGYTSAAGNTLVTFAKKDDMELVCVVMRAASTTFPENQYTDTRKLLEAAFDNYHLFSMAGSSSADEESAVSQSSPMFTKYSRLLSGEEPAITVSENSYIILPKDVKKKAAEQTITYHSGTLPSRTEDTIIGTVSYAYDKKTVGQADIIYHPASSRKLSTASEITYTVSMKDKLSDGIWGKLLEYRQFILIGLAFLLFIILLILMAARSRNSRNRRRKNKRQLELSFPDRRKSRRRRHPSRSSLK